MPNSLTPNFLPATTGGVWMNTQTEWDRVSHWKQERDVHFHPSLCVSPISKALRVSKEVERKVSSLQERVTVPTSSELVAKIRALSSDKLTPAMEATSLISSSSLDEMKSDEGKHKQQLYLHIFLWESGISFYGSVLWVGDRRCWRHYVYKLSSTFSWTQYLIFKIGSNFHLDLRMNWFNFHT